MQTIILYNWQLLYNIIVQSNLCMVCWSPHIVSAYSQTTVTMASSCSGGFTIQGTSVLLIIIAANYSIEQLDTYKRTLTCCQNVACIVTTNIKNEY